MTLHRTWLKTFVGRIHEFGRKYTLQLRECEEQVDEMITYVDPRDESVQKALAALQAMR
eukprot:CAMPEP_0206233212 /NCGR_PEP_ID=MMETSP0047_2-20121206/11860_1 /ASSEMBLY_ACC=CAM_ASM_000192 /TAXON_ID=195065 /ORGANISM="Chroomonas mesostigmatica_cf, Strain CCMP1168" /LENGTH=58 /DNA_ID=CAMNT_0053657063 /DNA_START=220 /DNA_END=396 /DNA_ORIENTATION=+